MTRRLDEDDPFAQLFRDGDGTRARDNGSGGIQFEDEHPGEPLDVEEQPFVPSVLNQDANAVAAYNEWSRRAAEGPPTGIPGAPRGLLAPPGVVPALDHGAEQMAEIVGREAQAVASIRREAQFTRHAPPTAATAVLGGRAEVAGVTASGAGSVLLKEVLRWAGKEIESQPVTITFAPTAPPGVAWLAGGGADIHAFCRITWGTRDAQYVVDLDAFAGQQVTLAASCVYVSVGLDGNNGGSGHAFSLSASLAFGATVRTAPLFFTSYVAVAAGGTGTTIIRPNFATQLYSIERPSADQITASFLTGGGVTLYDRTLAANAYVTTPIGLGGDVAAVNLTTTNIAGTTARVIWAIGL